jgi:hypothetical protein
MHMLARIPMKLKVTKGGTTSNKYAVTRLTGHGVSAQSKFFGHFVNPQTGQY